MEGLWVLLETFNVVSCVLIDLIIIIYYSYNYFLLFIFVHWSWHLGGNYVSKSNTVKPIAEVKHVGFFVCFLSKRAKRNEREYLNDEHPKKPNQSADQIFCLWTAANQKEVISKKGNVSWTAHANL